jgi:hypothetical protein
VVEPEDGWRTVRFPSGLGLPVRSGSPLDAAFSQDAEERSAAGPMELSLGYLGDLVWMRLPEARPLLADRIEREVQDAINIGRGLNHLSASGIAADVLWSPLMRRALEEDPLDRAAVARYLAVVREAYVADRPDAEHLRYALRTYVLESLAEARYRAVVEELDDELFKIVQRDVMF